MTLSGHHLRFEAFLKRTLDEAEYEKIRTIESCIVDSVLEKKSFQVVVVDCDGISLENCVPWKVIHFVDVISVELESDKPNFLKGQEQDDAQHIVIRYKTNNKPPKHLDKEFNRRSKPKKPNSKPKTSTTNSNNYEEDPSNSSTTFTRRASKDRSSTQTYPPTQQHPATATKVATEKEAKQVDLVSRDHKVLLESRHVVLSLPVDPLTHVKALSLTAKFKDAVIAEAVDQYLIVEVFTRNKERLFEITSKMINNNNNNNNSIDSRLAKFEVQGNQNMSITDTDFIAQLIKQKFKKGDRSCLDEGVMNLYVLKEKSMFYLLLKHAWINFKLRAASGKDLLCYDKFTTIPKYSLLVEREFVDLKADILSKLRKESLIPSDRLLIFKSHLTTDKPFRKLFWKDDNLFTGFVAYLKMLVTKLPADFKLTQERTEDNNKINRHLNDVIPSILISMEIICLSLQETEIYPDRSMHVTSFRGHYLECLVEMVCLEMDVEAEEHPRKKLNQQLLDFLVDFTYSSTNLLFEIFTLSSIHPFFCSSEKDFLTVEWLARFLVRKPHINNFLERIMSLLLSLTGAGDDMFSPSCTLFVYKCFHFIDTLTKYCRDVSHFLLEKYRVDLKYSLNLDFFRGRFPPNLQISADVFEIVGRVMDRIFSAKNE